MLKAGLLCSVAALAPGLAAACGTDTDCAVEGGTYRVALPDGEAAAGAVVFAHGYRGSAAGIMGNAGLIEMVTDRGLALIAPTSRDEDWDLPNAPGGAAGRDEVAYLDRVLADAEARFGIDPARVWISGFSAGGMFTWQVICERGDAYAGYVPYSGTFWQGPPQTCPAPAPAIVHIHGDDDSTVPMSGRPIDDTRQGDVHEVLRMYRDAKAYTQAEDYEMGDMECRHDATAQGDRLDLCIFPGGHDFRVERLSLALDRLGA